MKDRKKKEIIEIPADEAVELSKEIPAGVAVSLDAYDSVTRLPTMVAFFFGEDYEPVLYKNIRIKAKRKGPAFTTTMLIYGICFAAAIGCGVPLGMFVHSFFSFSENANYDNVTIGKVTASEELRAEYENAMSKGTNFEDWGANSRGIEDIMVMAGTLYGEAENTAWFCSGSATASVVNQTIRSCGIKNGEDYFTESLSSSSMVKVGLRSYQTGDAISYYRDGNVDDAARTADFASAEKIETDSEAYSELFGFDLTAFGNYYFGEYNMQDPSTGDILTYSSVITSPTSTADTEKLSSVTKNADGTYEVYIRLDITGGVALYATYMKNLSSLDARPSFTYCHLTYTLGSDLFPISCHIEEQYAAKTMGLSATTTTSMDITYDGNSSVTIPDVAADAPYPEDAQ